VRGDDEKSRARLPGLGDVLNFAPLLAGGVLVGPFPIQNTPPVNKGGPVAP